MIEGKVSVDRRTGSVELVPFFTKGMTVVEELEFGDMAFWGRGEMGCPVGVGVERKTIKDLLNSMVSGRFVDHQLKGLVQSYDQVWLVVEGKWRSEPETGILQDWGMDGDAKTSNKFVMKRKPGWRTLRVGKKGWAASMVERWLFGLQTRTQVKVVMTEDMKGTARWVEKTAMGWWNVPWEQHGSLEMMKSGEMGAGWAKFGRVTTCMRVAAQLPGVAGGKARKLAEKFGSVERLVGAGERELMEVDGIAKKLACGIREALRNNK